MFAANLPDISRRSTCFYALLVLLAINLLQTVYAVFFCSFLQADDLEHLHAAFFVANGDVPYRDFFEHHHPLLWYLLAPVVKILPHHTLFAVYTGRLLSLFVSLIGGYYIYKIEKKFLGSTICALVCLNLYFFGIPNISASALFNIKPDICMHCCFAGGLYYLLCYFNGRKFKDLQICAIFFTLSFFFLQTAVFMIAPLVVPVGYFLYKNPRQYKDFLKASMIPLFMLAFFVGLLWYAGILTTYWQTNWILNSYIGQILHTYPHTEKILLIIDILGITILALSYYLYSAKFDIYILCMAALFIFELSFRLFFNATFANYFPPLLIFAAMLAAPFVYAMILKFELVLYTFTAISSLHILANFYITYQPFFVEEHLQKTQAIAVASGFYQPRLSYYWMYSQYEGLDDALFHRSDNYDINELYRRANPEIIIINPSSTEDRVLKAFEPLQLNQQQLKAVKRHIPDINQIGNYIEIGENIYQRADTVRK